MLTRVDGRRVALGLILIGTAVRVALAIKLPATGDIENLHAAAGIIRRDGLSAYGTLNAFNPARPFNYRLFPYPPGFMPWMLLVDQLPSSAFAAAERMVPISADAVLAWLVAAELRARGADDLHALAATALIALGPVFIAVSAVNGQIDAVALLFVIVALRVWRTAPSDRRAVLAGLALGAGACVKTVPILFVIAFLSVVADRREGARLLLSAALVPVVLLTPFVIADAPGVRHSLGYSGFPGGGGLVLLADPGLARHYLSDYDLTTSGVAAWLQTHGVWLTLAAVALAAGWLGRRRLPPTEACVILALTILLFAANFYEQYLLWLLPVALVAGRLVLAAIIEAVAFLYLWATGALPYIKAAAWLGLSGRAAVEVGCSAALTAIFAVSLARSLAKHRDGIGASAECSSCAPPSSII